MLALCSFMLGCESKKIIFFFFLKVQSAKSHFVYLQLCHIATVITY